MRFYQALLILLTSPMASYGQCCSGGVPLSSNLGLPSGAAGVWQMSFSYDLNVLRTLKAGTIVLESGQRERLTQSALYEVAYGLTNKLSVNALVSYVRQERTIREFSDVDYVHTSGLGDPVLIVRYQIIPALIVGAGVKAPLGAYDRTNDSGNIVSADLQPGSGAWDLVLWGMYQAQLESLRPSTTFSAVTTYRMTGKNNDFRNGAQVYQFGNELLITANFSDQFLIGRLLIGPSAGVKYRTQGVDQTEIVGVTGEVPFPNSGGDFIFFNPGITFHFGEALDFQLNADLPVWTKVDGTQLAPTYRINTGLYWKFGGKDNVLVVEPDNL